MTIEGVPKGWELVRIGKPKEGEFFMLEDGEIKQSSIESMTGWYFPILRKIEKPKQYRPFANAAEFKPHRERWWKTKDGNRFYPPTPYGEDDHNGVSWVGRFENCLFDDGSPFGVEVAE